MRYALMDLVLLFCILSIMLFLALVLSELLILVALSYRMSELD